MAQFCISDLLKKKENYTRKWGLKTLSTPLRKCIEVVSMWHRQFAI